jgi:hypothetical protein
VSFNRFSVAADQVAQRVRLNLTGDGGPTASTVAWGDYHGTVVLHLSTLKFRAADGWLLCNLGVSVPGQTASTLQFLFRTALEDDPDPLVVAGGVRADDVSANALADDWGAILQRVIWDGVLDVIEGVVNHAESQSPGRALTLMGFLAAEGLVHVEVQTADA